MNQQSRYRAFRSDDNNNSIIRKYAKNKILKNREPKNQTKNWVVQATATCVQRPSTAISTHVQRPSTSNSNTWSDTFNGKSMWNWPPTVTSSPSSQHWWRLMSKTFCHKSSSNNSRQKSTAQTKTIHGNLQNAIQWPSLQERGSERERESKQQEPHPKKKPGICSPVVYY